MMTVLRQHAQAKSEPYLMPPSQRGRAAKWLSRESVSDSHFSQRGNALRLRSHRQVVRVNPPGHIRSGLADEMGLYCE